MTTTDRPLITIIAGGRDYQFTPQDEKWLDTLPIGEVVCGGASGADECGKQWALKKNIPVRAADAQWGKYGDAAGMIRNVQMAAQAEAVALFPGGKGTRNMLDEATRRGLKIFLSPRKRWNEKKDP